MEVLAQMHRLDPELRRAQLYVCTAPLMTLAGVQDGISDFRDFPWIYIYIYGAHGIKIWIYPWKMLGLDISWTFQGTIWDFLENFHGHFRPKNEIFMEKVIGRDLSKHRYGMGKLWYTN